MTAELWADFVAEAADEAGATLTPEQCKIMGASLFGCVDIGRDRHGLDDNDVAMAVRKLREARDIANSAALSPAPAPAPYEPSEAEIKSVSSLLFEHGCSPYRMGVKEMTETCKTLIRTVIAAHNARSAKT